MLSISENAQRLGGTSTLRVGEYAMQEIGQKRNRQRRRIQGRSFSLTFPSHIFLRAAYQTTTLDESHIWLQLSFRVT
jgi:hypothetical protein